jgi:hypothetical protein
MTSLPLISHHLFVAAVGNEARARVKPVRKEASSLGLTRHATAIPLQVLARAQPLPARATHPLRASLIAGGP